MLFGFLGAGQKRDGGVRWWARAAPQLQAHNKKAAMSQRTYAQPTITPC